MIRATLASSVTALLLLRISSATAAESEAETMRLDESTVVALALSSSPSVDAAKSERDAASAGSSAADLARLPDLTVSARYTRLSSIPERYRTFGGAVFPQILDNLGTRAELSLPLSEAFLGLAATARAAGHRAEAAELEVVNTRARVAYETKVAFYTYTSRVHAEANARELVRVAEGQALDARRRVASGTMSKNEALAYETALDSAKMNLASASAEVGTSAATLFVYVPALRGKSLEVPPLEAIERAKSRGADAPRNTPRIASLEAELRAAESAGEATSLSRLPRLSAYGAADVSAPSPRVFVLDRLTAIPTWEVGVRLEWSFSQATVGTAREAESRHRASAVAAQLTVARRTLAAEREGAKASFVAADERLALAKGRVERARELSRARRGELAAGTALPLAVVVAEADVLRAENEHVDAAIERALALAKIDFADGRVGTEPTGVAK
jgi:outer membrane protein TolC